ncbi:MAG: hypothetical protein KDB14_17600, partial [Planctomycetales bacterium]|nr:hypothetical protein [Planctomycetales bacterium]
MQRVTSQLNTRYALHGIRTQSTNAAKAQLELTTGKRVRTPSDDPLAFRSISSLEAEVRRLDTELQSISSARGTLNMSVTRLTEARTLLTAATTAAQQSRDGENRDTHAATIDSVLEQLVRLGNDQSERRYVFGGAQPLSAPLEVTREGGKIVGVEFVGSKQPLTTPIGAAFSVDTSLPARSVFAETGGGGAVSILSRTGVQPGTGTDSSHASGLIQIRNTGTSYLGGSGVAAGTSASNDTIIGQAGTHTLTLVDDSGTGAFGTVSLDGGPAVSFTNADTDLQLSGPNGELVHLDLSSISPGFSGTVDIVATGSVSIDNGATSVAIDFSSNQQLIHGETGATINLDTSGVIRSGDDPFDHPGSSNLFETLIALRDDLLNARGLTEREFQDALTSRLGDLERLTDHLLDNVGEQAVALENLDTAQALTEDVKLESQISLSQLEDSDVAEAVL